MRGQVTKWALAAVLAFGAVGIAQPDEASAYSANVLRARAWLKERTSDRQFRCLHVLWENESNWRVGAGHPSRAYGIPQAYPGYKMGSAGSDWRTNATTQVRWGLRYIRNRFGRPCAALAFQNRNAWY
ncbi:hypothetical protein BH23CHL8_BH23CHL8_31090 [soil metagenome]